MDTILVVNAGSSSVKFQVFVVEGGGGLRRRNSPVRAVHLAEVLEADGR